MVHKRYEEEVFYGLGRPTLGINDILHDEDTSAKKFTRNHTASYSPEMYQAMQEIVSHKSLPFAGNMSAFIRHAVGITLEQLELFLDDDSKTIFRSLMTQQRRMTRERFIVTLEDSIDQQVDILRFWTVKAKWGEVVRTAEAFCEEVIGYPVAAWREHAASMWTRNQGLRELLKVWTGTMKDDSPGEWQAIERVWRRMEQMSNG